MAAGAGFASLPDELISQVLLTASTPTFIQLTRSSKRLFHLASHSRKVLLHHLHQIPGDKSTLDYDSLDTQLLFQLLRQRATNNLIGTVFNANVHEYIARDIPIDPVASSIGGLDADYVRMALCFKGSADIRQYTGQCAIKEKIKQISGPGIKVLKLVQWGRFVSALCFLPSSRTYDDLSDTALVESSESETEVLAKTPFTPTANAQLQHLQHKGRNDRLIKILRLERYQVVHFDVYTIEDSQIFEIMPPPDAVPRDFAVQSSSLCAILWDKDTPGGRPTESAQVVTYTIDHRMEDTMYDPKTVWPKSGKPVRPDGDSDDDDVPDNLPERISFFKEGRRIKMYNSGGIVPYQIFSTSTTQYDQYATTNVLTFDGFTVHVDTPFFGTHTTQNDEIAQQSYCFTHYLCLGVATLNLNNGNSDEEVKILCILRSANRQYPDACQHRICLGRMTHVSANNCTIVARLWGWTEPTTTFSGRDTVAVSPGGTRIAIAMWNKVLVYPLNPKVLCDEVVVDSSDDEVLKPKKKKKKSRKTWEKPCTDYYQRTKDKNLLGWKVAELRPIVLDLNGAIAHKMSWSSAKGTVTDTEGSVLVPSQDVEDIDGLNDDDNESADTNDQPEAIAIPSQGQTVEAVVDITSDDAQSASQDSTSSAAAQQIIEETIETTAPPSNEGNEDSFQAQPTEIQITNENTDQQQIVTEPEADVKPGQISPVEPQSPVQATKKSELSFASGALGTSTPNSPPTTNNTFLSNFTPSPCLPFGVSTPSQPSKLSIRKKEKTAETNVAENTGLAGFEKKSYSTLSLAAIDSNLTQDNQPSWSPTYDKAGQQPNQTVAEALAVNPPSTAVTSPEVAATTAPLASMTAAPLDTIQTIESNIPNAPELEMDQIPDEDVDDNATPNHSKNPSSAAASHTKSQEEKPIQDESDTKSKPKKRITEDELIILTDRGIQVWNLGARAKGKRKKSILKLEESLRGRLPRMKGKRKETAVLADDSD